jgi:poly-gamma-glutamate synthesis protein (capsule biosynthesis protein)
VRREHRDHIPSALAELERVAPAARIINLETSVTVADENWRYKSIHYRMHPANVGCLTAAKIDCCVLANNHVLDWGFGGLTQTLDTLNAAGLLTCGAGSDAPTAAAPAAVNLAGGGRVLVFGCGSATSGIPGAWAAGPHSAGVNLLDDLSVGAAQRVARTVERFRRGGDIVVASVHWGPNWGYTIPHEQREFAHALIDAGAVDIVHGHSSHHAKGIEVYRDKPIIYGCGDFLNDYEGISGHRDYRGDLSLAYFVGVETSNGALVDLRIKPMQIRRFSLHDATAADAEWLVTMLDHVGQPLGTRVELGAGRQLALRWRPSL